MGQERFTPQDYINKYKEMAIADMHKSGVPASITLAQGILESGSGNSELAKKAKNHFGVKGHRDWTGDCFYMDDDAENECFRVYKSVAESYEDHSNFLHSHQRYASLFELRSTDYKGWAHGLKKAGYATNPEYANILIRLIEKYELYQYDQKPAKRFLKKDIPDVFTINQTEAIAYDGEMSLREVRDKYYFAEWQIYKYNDLNRGDELKKGQVLYLKPKRKNNSTITTHKVEEGENMQFISQLYGIKLRHLRKLNNLSKGEEPAVGAVLNLKDKADSKPALNNSPNNGLVYYTIDVVKPEPAVVVDNKTPETAVKKPIQKADGVYHKVAPGESLSSIARAYDMNWKVLKAQNGLEDNGLNVGQMLLIEPQAGQAIDISAADTIQIEEAPKVVLQETQEVYTVQAGDTLFEIARIKGMTVAEVMRLNKMDEPAIKEGMVLKLAN
ncbi:MAG: LysM peptidoglycan-binding domain-containing protein [Bacteroidetes bacterium]|nr:LysM peptidoglycan-binding domain-containing protein [Bacteroidota bacterium]